MPENRPQVVGTLEEDLNRSISDVKFVAEVYIYTATNLTCVIPLLDINFMYGCQQTFCRECDLMKIRRVLGLIRSLLASDHRKQNFPYIFV